MINEIKIDLNKKWKEDHLNKFRNSYKETKHYKKVINLVEEIFSNVEKVIIDGEGGASGVVPYLPLKELSKSTGGN